MVSHYENIYSLDAVNNGWNKDWSKHLDSFEEKFSDFIGTKYAIATSSCTGAIYLSLLAGGISEGDEVIVPELTWVATASAIKYTGAKPIFADIDIDTWCIDTGQLENLVTEKTKAIIPVHLYGNPAKMDEIISFAKKHNLIVEDAAQQLVQHLTVQKWDLLEILDLRFQVLNCHWHGGGRYDNKIYLINLETS